MLPKRWIWTLERFQNLPLQCFNRYKLGHASKAKRDFYILYE